MVIVLDTNVIVSSVINKHGPSAKIRQLWKEHELFDVAVSNPILEEIERVMGKKHIQKRHGWSKEGIHRFVKNLREKCYVVSPTKRVRVVKNDPTDNMFFECALEAQARFIISGNEKHVLKIPQYKGIRVVSPRDFVENIIENAA